VIVAAAALMAGVSTVAMAQSQDAAHAIANNGSLFIDGRKFTIASGSSERDISAQIETLGAKQLGSSAIIFRSGDKLYIADAAPASLSAVMLYEPTIERQRPKGLPAVHTTLPRPQGIIDDGYRRPPQAYLDDGYRRPPQAFLDNGFPRQQPQADSMIERQRAYINDPDYGHYKLKKTFEEVWTVADKK